ncbi:DNA polymerase III PolC-type-like [Condylostylus longicornis]|uniref:DNA polymerase III PolC-type-like n=1 Tax=Condylostylus longicornis TaxID=2530218 RepID=UPI00244DEB99|nr:DNA polymerase III PolC-type-like [Condylostylus longicornis]
MNNKNNFKTYAVFDIETTGLPHLNFNKVNIIEFAVSTVSRDDIVKSKTGETPRIINNLSLLFNPRMRIDPESSKITGLDNYQLEHENSFDENAAKTIIGFFKHLQGPICLVAHNGDRFDFPILKKAFEKVNLSLPENVYCVDTYKAIPYIDHTKKIDEENKEKEEADKLLSLEEALLDNEVKNSLKEQFEINSTLKEEKFDIQKINETTPHRPTKMQGNKAKENTYSELLENKQNRNDILSNHCEISHNSPQNKGDKKVKRELFKQSPESDLTSETPKKITIPRSPKGYYTLTGIFKRIFYEPKKSHHAGADVEMLQKIIINYGEDFVKYSELNAIPFSEVNSLGSKT